MPSFATSGFTIRFTPRDSDLNSQSPKSLSPIGPSRSPQQPEPPRRPFLFSFLLYSSRLDFCPAPFAPRLFVFDSSESSRRRSFGVHLSRALHSTRALHSSRYSSSPLCLPGRTSNVYLQRDKTNKTHTSAHTTGALCSLAQFALLFHSHSLSLPN